MGDSLFGSDTDSDSSDTLPDTFAPCTCTPASLDVPPIRGLYLFRSLLPPDVQDSLLRAILDAQAITTSHPQAMLFPRSSAAQRDTAACPDYLVPFVKRLPELLEGLLEQEDYETVFDESKPLQTILNLYEPGTGITPHVDLPHRYAEPIIGISLLSSIVMDLLPVDPTRSEEHHIVLDPGDVYVLLHDARYAYQHGIAYRDHDVYMDKGGRTVNKERTMRVSITFRRMKDDSTMLSVDG